MANRCLFPALNVRTAVTLAITTALSGLAGVLLDKEPETIGAVVMHATLSAVCVLTYVRTISRRGIHLLTSPVAVFTLIELLYLGASSLKYYSGNPAYPEFALATSDRLAGSCGAAGLILFQTHFLLRGARAAVQERAEALLGRRAAISMLTLAVTLGLGLYVRSLGFVSTHNANAGLSTALTARDDTSVLLAASAFMSLAIIAVASATARAFVVRSRVSRTALAVACVAVAACDAVLFQSRWSLLSLVAAALCGADATVHRPAVWRYITYMLLLTPILGLLGGGLILTLVGRSPESGAEAMLDEIAYRVDLTDYAISAMREPPRPRVPIEAIANSLPRMWFPDKDSYVPADSPLAKVGKDYCDTVFSTGVLWVGISGFVLFPLLHSATLGWMSRGLGRWRHQGLGTLCLISLSAISLNIELGWPELFIIARTYAMLVLVVVLIAGMARSCGRRLKVPPELVAPGI